MYILKSHAAHLSPFIVLATTLTLSGCSGLTESVSASAQASIDPAPSIVTDEVVGRVDSVNEEAKSVSSYVVDEEPSAGYDESIFSDTPTQHAQLDWGGTNFFARWVGDEFWTASSAASEETEDSLAAAYDVNSDVDEARFTQE